MTAKSVESIERNSQITLLVPSDMRHRPHRRGPWTLANLYVIDECHFCTFLRHFFVVRQFLSYLGSRERRINRDTVQNGDFDRGKMKTDELERWPGVVCSTLEKYCPICIIPRVLRVAENTIGFNAVFCSLFYYVYGEGRSRGPERFGIWPLKRELSWDFLICPVNL